MRVCVCVCVFCVRACVTTGEVETDGGGVSA